MLSRLQDSDLRFVAEMPNHASVIDRICAEAFGPGRFVRAAERVREAAPHDPRLSLVAILNDEVVGSVRQTRCAIGITPVVMLGPLAVRPAFKRRGTIGKLDTRWSELTDLRDLGRAAAERWLAAHEDDLGRRSSLEGNYGLLP